MQRFELDVGLFLFLFLSRLGCIIEHVTQRLAVARVVLEHYSAKDGLVKVGMHRNVTE